MPTISPEARQRALVARHHLGRGAPGILEAVDDLIALHSSDPLTPHLALRARVGGYRPALLDDAVPHDLWRLHAMRRTLWVAPSSTVGRLDAAVGQAVLLKERRALVGWVAAVRADAEPWLDALTDAILSEVAVHPGIHTRQLHAAIPALTTPITVGSGRWTSQVPVGSRLLFCLALELRLVRSATSGSWKTSQYGWRVAPEIPRPTAEDGRRWLVERYLDRFGPVTMADLRWWTGLTAAQVRRALATIDTDGVTVGGEDAWMLTGQRLPEAEGVSLLPGLDPTPMGYTDRAWFLGAHGDALFDRNGNVGPTVWLDGRIVGGWATDASGVVRTRLLEQVGARATEAVAHEAAALTRWLDGVSVTPRFRTPLERTLADTA